MIIKKIKNKKFYMSVDKEITNFKIKKENKEAHK